MQMCAKVGGEPWAMDSIIPVKEPITIVGINITKCAKKESLIAFCATRNPEMNQYISLVRVFNENEIEQIFEEMTTDILIKVKFFLTNFSLKN